MAVCNVACTAAPRAPTTPTTSPRRLRRASSNGAGTATAASFAAFGLAEETWSSGRGPASNNGLCAYTPSRGVISVRGNWPLTPTMDVVVPYARTMADLLEVLDVVVAEDPDTRGDLWRLQPWVPIPSVASVRPASYPALAVSSESLAGKRFGVPRMYINADPEAGTSEKPGIGGPTGQKIHTRATVIELWQAARQALEAAGAEVIEVDFPAGVQLRRRPPRRTDGVYPWPGFQGISPRRVVGIVGLGLR